MKRSGFKGPRKPLKRGTKQLKRSGFKNRGKGLKRGKKGLRSKPYVRTPEQKAYHDEHPKCEMPECRNAAMPTPHHIDARLLRADTQENMWSACWWHHIGPVSVHILGVKAFCERFGLTKHLKWAVVYSRVEWR